MPITAAQERRAFDAGDAGWDGDAGQAEVAREGSESDDIDWQAIDGAGDGDITSRSGVTGDSDLALIGDVSILCLDRGRQRRQQQRQK